MSKITAINSYAKGYTHNRYLIGLGAYGWTILLVYANNLEDAIEECADWCHDNAPGLFCDDQVAEEYNRCIAASKMNADYAERADEYESEAYEQSTTDTIACDGGHYFLSWEVHLISENPSRLELLAITGNPEKERAKRVRKSKAANRSRTASGKLLMRHWVNPWPDAVPVPIDELVTCFDGLGQTCARSDGSRFVWDRVNTLEYWKQAGKRLDAYILPSGNFHCIGIRYGSRGNQYLSPGANQERTQALLEKYMGKSNSC